MATQQIERVNSIDPEEFLSEFNTPARPVIITNALHWPAFGKWSHEWFRDTYGDLEIELSTNPTHTYKPVKMRLGKYMQRIIDNQKMEGGLYLAQFPLQRLPALSQDFTLPPYCNREREVMPHLWIGPGTTVVSLHKDNHHPLSEIENIFVQVQGSKRILLASPDNDPLMYPRPRETGAYWHSEVNPEAADLQRFPLFAKATLQEGVVGPGDLLYIPRNYWHYVRALERSISMSFWWNPCRLMEVMRLVNTQDERALEELGRQGRLSLTLEDITELGGVPRLQSEFAQFDDIATLTALCARLTMHADQPARQAIYSALETAGVKR